MEIRQGRPDGFFLFAEVGENFLHALGLVDMEGTAAVAVAAGDAVLRGMLEREIVLLGKTVAELCKVIVFVDEGNIEPRRGRGGSVCSRHICRACFRARR